MTSIKELKADKQKYRNDPTKYIEIINLIGHKYLELGRFDEAVDEHLEAISTCRKVKNEVVSKELEALSRRALGECYSEMGRHEEALDEQDRFLLITLQLNDLIEIERAYTTIGRTHLLWAQDASGQEARIHLHKSQEYFQKALKQGEGLKSSGKLKEREYADVRSRLLINLGLVHENLGDFERSRELLEEAIQLTKLNYLNEDLYRCQISLSAIYEKLDLLDEARELCEKSLETSRTLKDKMRQFDSFVSLAMIVLKQGDVHEARRFLKRAYYLQTSQPEEQKKVRELLLIVTAIREDLNKKILLQTNLEKDLDQMIELCDRLGDNFVEIKCYPMAVKYYKMELQYALDANKSDLFLAKIYVSIGQTYMDDAMYQEAIDNFQQESFLIASCGSVVEQTESLMKIADCQESMLSNLDDMEIEKKDQLTLLVIETYRKALALFDLNRLQQWWQCTKSGFSQTIENLREDLKTLMTLLRNFSYFLDGTSGAPGLESSLADEVKDHLSKFNDFEKKENEEETENEEVIFLDSAMNNENASPSKVSSARQMIDFDLSSDSEAEPELDEEIPENLRPRRTGGRVAGGTKKLNQFGETPLHTACIAGNLTQVERLVEQGVNLNAKDYCGWTPLHEAANHGHLEIVECLLMAGADIEMCDDRSERITPLHDACQCGNLNVIRLLLKYDANVLAMNSNRETPLQCLMSWRRRTARDLSDSEMAECLTVENELMERMKAKGYDLERINETSQKNLTSGGGKQIRRRNLVNYLLYDDETDKKRQNIEVLNVDEPGYGHREYRSAIDQIRGKKLGKGCTIKDRQGALIEEEVVRDDWLIDDLKKSSTTAKKRDLVGYSEFGGETKKRKPSLAIKDITSEEGKKKRSRTDDESRDSFNNFEDYLDCYERNSPSPPRTTIELAESTREDEDSCDLDLELVKSVVNKISPLKNNKHLRKEESACGNRLVTVYFEDKHKSAFAVPITSDQLDCRWLMEELTRRYFRRYYIKPNLSLVTRSSGAFLSEDDQILSVIDSSNSLTAKIISYKIETADKRYSELCTSENLTVNEDIEAVLKYANISGIFRITNTFLGNGKQTEMMFQALCRQELKELDISFTNALIERDCYPSFKTLLPSLTTLEVLNLTGVAFPRPSLRDLLNVSPVLRVLNLSYNSIGDEQSYALADIVKLNTRLQIINLTACDLSMQTVANRLFIAAVENSSLHSLVLDYNEIEQDVIESFRNLYVDRTFLKSL